MSIEYLCEYLSALRDALHLSNEGLFTRCGGGHGEVVTSEVDTHVSTQVIQYNCTR